MNAQVAVCWSGAAPCPVLDGVTVVGVRGHPEREAARLAIRAMLTDALAAHCGVDAAHIELYSPLGAAPWAMVDLADGPRRIALAISHDGDISVAAFSFGDAVGIDVSQIVPVPDWEPVARDYLGPDAAQALAAMQDDARDAAFAHAWSEYEARLKCLGLPLEEWRADLAAQLQACRCLPLALPEGYAGSLALPPAA